jgi:hypothetical protein
MSPAPAGLFISPYCPPSSCLPPLRHRKTGGMKRKPTTLTSTIPALFMPLSGGVAFAV